MGQDNFGGLTLWFTVMSKADLNWGTCNFLRIRVGLQEAKLKPSSHPQAQWVPSIGCSSFKNWVSRGPFHGVQFFRNRLLQNESPTCCSSCKKTFSFGGSCPQAAVSARSFFLCGLSVGCSILQGMCTCSGMGSCTGLRWISICSIIILHGPPGKKKKQKTSLWCSPNAAMSWLSWSTFSRSFTDFMTSGSLHSQFCYCSLLNLLQSYLL